MYFTVELSRIAQSFLVAIRPGETPVPIPNTTVKARAADGTALETAWESRRAPEQKKKELGILPVIIAYRGLYVLMTDKTSVRRLYLENCIHVKYLINIKYP